MKFLTQFFFLSLSLLIVSCANTSVKQKTNQAAKAPQLSMDIPNGWTLSKQFNLEYKFVNTGKISFINGQKDPLESCVITLSESSDDLSLTHVQKKQLNELKSQRSNLQVLQSNPFEFTGRSGTKTELSWEHNQQKLMGALYVFTEKAQQIIVSCQTTEDNFPIHNKAFDKLVKSFHFEQ